MKKDDARTNLRTRIAKLTRRLSELEARRAELAADQDDGPEQLSDDDLRALQAHIHEVIQNGDKPARKALLQALLEEIRVVSRAEIYPFSLPVVRPPYGSVRLAGINPSCKPRGSREPCQHPCQHHPAACDRYAVFAPP